MSPALVVLVLLTLIASQLLYAFAPYRRRSYLVILAFSAVGIAAGQLWAVQGLPAWKIGEAAVLPGLLFVLVLQPLAGRIPAIRLR